MSSEPMSDERLAEIRALLAGLSGLPWDETTAFGDVFGANGFIAESDTEEIGAFIAQSPRIVQELLAEHAALTAFLRRFVAHDDNPWLNDRVSPQEARALLGTEGEAQA
jgi:hypothetical protein